jgi:hypothetical protein
MLTGNSIPEKFQHMQALGVVFLNLVRWTLIGVVGRHAHFCRVEQEKIG